MDERRSWLAVAVAAAIVVGIGVLIAGVVLGKRR